MCDIDVTHLMTFMIVLHLQVCKSRTEKSIVVTHINRVKVMSASLSARACAFLGSNTESNGNLLPPSLAFNFHQL